MTPRTEQRRMNAAGWKALPRGYLPADLVERIEQEIEEHAEARARILAEEKRLGRPQAAR